MRRADGNKIKFFEMLRGILIKLRKTLKLLSLYLAATLTGAAIWLWAAIGPPKIMDFQPVVFSEIADAPFFYSIGTEFKYGERIDPTAPTLLTGVIGPVVVSPDNFTAAAVADGNLWVVRGDGSENRLITPVRPIYSAPKSEREESAPKPEGDKFFRDGGFQWSSDGKYLFIVKDEYYETNDGPFRSEKKEIWQYSIQSGSLVKIVPEFQAFSYFLDHKRGIYLIDEVEPKGVELRYFDGEELYNVAVWGGAGRQSEPLHPDILKEVFFSFSIFDYERGVLPQKSLRLQRRDKVQQLVFGDRVLVQFSVGNQPLVSNTAPRLTGSIFLPGDEYFLLNVNAGNYDGQLLIDVRSGKYKTLPKGTRIYPLMNTNNYLDFCITKSGIEPIQHYGRCWPTG